MLCTQKGAGEIDRQGLIPALFRNACRRSALADDTGVVNRDIQPSKLIHGRINKGLRKFLRLYITGE